MAYAPAVGADARPSLRIPGLVAAIRVSWASGARTAVRSPAPTRRHRRPAPRQAWGVPGTPARPPPGRDVATPTVAGARSRRPAMQPDPAARPRRTAVTQSYDASTSDGAWL